MSAGDFIRERRTVEIGSRRFTIRRLTVAAVVRALELFPQEIGLCYATAKEWPNNWKTMSIADLVASIPLDPHKLASVLRLVVESEGSPVWPVQALAIEVLGMSDLERIGSGFDFDREEEPGPLALERDVIDLATRFSCAPHDIMDWPFEEYLGVLDVLGARQTERVGVNVLKTVAGPVLPWLSYEKA